MSEFKFIVGDKVYIENILHPATCCPISHFSQFTIQYTFSQNGLNYYRLENGAREVIVLEESYLLSEYDYHLRLQQMQAETCECVTEKLNNFPPPPINYLLYVEKKARVGILDRVAIKQLIQHGDVILIQDTFNGLWNIEDLVEYDEAKVLAQNYLEKKCPII